MSALMVSQKHRQKVLFWNERSHEPMGHRASGLQAIGDAPYALNQESALNWMHVHEPTFFLRPFLSPRKSKLVVDIII
jgi:hypothetical protein